MKTIYTEDYSKTMNYGFIELTKISNMQDSNRSILLDPELEIV